MGDFEIITINETEWEKINARNSFPTFYLGDKQTIVFALDNYLHGYFKVYKSENYGYYLKVINKLFKVYCYNLKEELRDNEEKVKSLFIARTGERNELRLKITAKNGFWQYLWCPGDHSLISQADVNMDSQWISEVSSFPEVGNKKKMFRWYQCLLPPSLINELKKYQWMIIQFEKIGHSELRDIPFPFLFNGQEYLGNKMMFSFSNNFGIREKPRSLDVKAKSLALVGNLYMADKSMESEVNHLYKYLKFFYLNKKIKYLSGEIKQEDFLFALQHVEYLHYSGHAKRTGLYFSDGIAKAETWLSLNSLPKVMVFSCCEFLTSELALKLIEKGVVTILSFEGEVVSRQVQAFVKDMYWQWMTAELSLIEAVRITFKKHLYEDKIRFYPKIYGEGFLKMINV